MWKPEEKPPLLEDHFPRNSVHVAGVASLNLLQASLVRVVTLNWPLYFSSVRPMSCYIGQHWNQVAAVECFHRDQTSDTYDVSKIGESTTMLYRKDLWTHE